MDTIKLSYFKARGLGEGIRFLLSYMGKPFEDYRFEWDTWTSNKEVSPFGKLPMIEINGKVACQSRAISRYLGKMAQLHGDNDEEALEIDMVGDSFEDFRVELTKPFYEQDPTKKESLRRDLLEKSVPFYLSTFDQIIGKNGGFLANGKLSWVDFYFVAYLPTIEPMLGVDVLDKEKYPNINKLSDTVHAIPSIKKWVESRPTTEY